jgi:hypothetical protein
MEGQIRELIRQKIVDSLAAPVPDFTRAVSFRFLGAPALA